MNTKGRFLLIFLRKKMYIMGMEQLFANIGTVGGLAGIAAILAVFVSHFKNRQNNKLETFIAESKSNSEAFRAQIQAMQASFDSQLKAMHADSKSQNEAFRTQIQAMQGSFDRQLDSWKGLWEASTQEIRELKMEIKELRAENDKLRTEILELKGQLKEHYKLA